MLNRRWRIRYRRHGWWFFNLFYSRSRNYFKYISILFSRIGKASSSFKKVDFETFNKIFFKDIRFFNLIFLWFRLRNEIDQVLGSKNDIDNEDLSKLTYLSCVYKETLRLWPPIPEIARLIDADFNVEGLKVPEKTWLQVTVHIYIQNSCKKL